jgi:hypothetical protein
MLEKENAMRGVGDEERKKSLSVWPRRQWCPAQENAVDGSRRDVITIVRVGP